MAAIVIKNLYKTFRKGFRKKVEAVRDLNLTIEKEEIFGFIGPNGAGKSTTIKILLNLLFPDSGEIHIFGKPVNSYKTRERIGFIPENPVLYEHLTAREFLWFAGRLSGVDEAILRKRVPRFLEMVGLKKAGGIRLGKYSKGMNQRLAIAQTLINDPDLIVMDEPLSGLDPLGRRDMLNLIEKSRNKGKTIFFSSHILHDVTSVCDRVALIVKGRLKFLGEPSEKGIEEIFKRETEWGRSRPLPL